MQRTMANNRVLATGCKEIVRLLGRDQIQHNFSRPIVNFMRAPLGELTADIGSITHNVATQEVPGIVLSYLEQKTGIPVTAWRLSEYKSKSALSVMEKELIREGDLPTRMLTLSGSVSRPSRAEESECYKLGVKLAKARLIAVVSSKDGMMRPVLEGIRDNNGLSIGILSERDVKEQSGSIIDTDGLISLPIVVPSTGDDMLKNVVAAMSGRIHVSLNKKNGTMDNVRALMVAAYNGIPSLLVNSSLPSVARHPLQSAVTYDSLWTGIEKYLDPGSIEDSENYGFVQEARRVPISIFAGSKYDANQVTRGFAERLGALMAKNHFLTITGAGPGAMNDVARCAQPHCLTVGMNLCPTYISTNPYIDIPIVGNMKLERSKWMAASSFATINLGGSHTTFDELVATREMGKPIINCMEHFSTDFLRRITSSRRNAPVLSASSPSKALQLLQSLL